MFYILWQFDVEDAHAAAFAEAYGPAGPWEALFRQGDGFRGTEVFRRTAAREALAFAVVLWMALAFLFAMLCHQERGRTAAAQREAMKLQNAILGK